MINTGPLTALITGGGTGIGAACALRLAEDGYRVLITGRHEKTLKQSCTRHDNIDYLVADVTRTTDIETLGREIEQRLGHLNVLVNNAGIAPMLTFEDTSLKDFDNIFGTNVRGLLHVSQISLPALKKSRGCIVNISSIAADRPASTMSVYSASKAAVSNMTRSMARELIAYGIRVNAVSPGPVETPAFEKLGLEQAEQSALIEQTVATVPMGRLGQAEEVANIVAFLASGKASYVTGANYSADGGMLA